MILGYNYGDLIIESPDYELVGIIQKTLLALNKDFYKCGDKPIKRTINKVNAILVVNSERYIDVEYRDLITNKIITKEELKGLVYE